MAIERKLLLYIIGFHVTDAAYSPATKIESARLFGNINSYAYYFVDLEVGRPVPQKTSVIVDTGSNLVGFPCNGRRFHPTHLGNHLYPPFNLSNSQTAQWLPCLGHECNYGCTDNRCHYSMFYTEGSSITGEWFQDFVQMGDLSQNNPAVYAQLGCHEEEKKLFYTQRANGIMGFAPSDIGGAPTILTTLFKDNAHVNQDIFSMCLAAWGGRLNVGGYNASYHIGPIAWLPLSLGKYYSIALDSMSLAAVPGVSPPALIAAGQESFGPAMLDSGTTYVYFPEAVFANLDRAIHVACDSGACQAQRFDDECWKLNPGAVAIPSAFPVISMQFGASTLAWHPQAYLYQRGSTGIWCRAYASNRNSVQTVLGASWMLQREVIFDIQERRAGFAEANCPSYRRGFDALDRKNEVLPAMGLPADLTRVGFVCLAVAAVLSVLALRMAHLRSCSSETDNLATREIDQEVE